jgi:PAS domain S-box-containing protein
MLQGVREQVQRQYLSGATPMWRWVALTVAVGVIYFLAARLGLLLMTKPGVAVFWPAAGISSGTLIALGRAARWPVAVGVISANTVANLMGDRTIWSASLFSLCNAGEALFVAWMIERYVGSDFNLGRLRHVLGLLGATIVGTVVSGVGGAVAYKLSHSPDVSPWTVWQQWVASDSIGIVTIAPLVIGLTAAVRAPPPRSELIEGVVALVAVAVTTGMIIFLLPPTWWDIDVLVVLLFPLLLWPAARCRPVFASAVTFVVSVMIVSALTFDIGHFNKGNSSSDGLVSGAQVSILGIALVTLVLASLFAERRDSEDRMRAIVNTVLDAIITIDEKGIVETLNPTAARVFGYRPEEVVGQNVKMRMPDPYSHEHDRYISNYLKTGQAKIIGFGREVTGLRKDGSIFPMELQVGEMTAAGRRMFTGVVRDISERKQVDEHQKLLVAELDHRVKNVLARVSAVAMSTRQVSGSGDEFTRSLNGRLESMGTAHNLLSHKGWRDVDLRDLVRSQLAPYATDTNVVISGGKATLTSEATQAIAMVLHELATNAAKYGALSLPDGQVSVNWDFRTNKAAASVLKIEWCEIGGPPVAPSTHSSYGTDLIRELIPHELGGHVDLVFAPTGVHCSIEIPNSAEVNDGRASLANGFD